jgi:hypothetical protein
MPYCGPTAWMTWAAPRRKPGVATASPTSTGPRARQASRSSGPAAACSAPETPAPLVSRLFAALTTASTPYWRDVAHDQVDARGHAHPPAHLPAGPATGVRLRLVVP